MRLAEWYQVEFDNEYIYRRVAPPERASWSHQFRWDTVERVCFVAGDLFESDELYFFPFGQKEGYLIPTEADGGQVLVNEVLRRNLIPAMLMIQAAASVNEAFCWPPIEEQDQNAVSES